MNVSNFLFRKAVFGVLTLVMLMLAPVDGVNLRAAAMSVAAPLAIGPAAAGSTLGVARAGGTSLYDAAGKPILELPAGAALKVTGRTTDSRWVYGATRDGTAGWADPARLVIFGIPYLPVREGFTAPAAQGAASPPAARAITAAGAAVGLPAIVTSGAERLNVRSGPATGFAVVATLAPGAEVQAVARNVAADWVQLAQAGSPGWVSAAFLDFKGGDARSLPLAAQIPATPAAAPVSGAAAGGAAPTDLTGVLVFQERSGGKIFVYDLRSGALRVLTTGADPAISPDGRTVAFWRGGAENGLYLIGVDGANERRILSRTEPVRAPAWSPDGAKIVFSHVNGEDRCRDAGYGICLPDRFPYNMMFPLITTDRWGLARINREGGDYQDLAAVSNAITPNWSGRGIYYAGAGIQATDDISDNAQNRQVLGEARYQDPAVQPAGDSSIVFASLEKDHWEIFSAGADGANVVALTRPETTLVSPLPHNVAPAWSPDGAHIVFLSNRSVTSILSAPGQWRLWVMNADGSNKRPLPIDVPIEYNYSAEQVVSWGK
jgi:dipeptidyl aminopeptidase/acylaminoacyl peptidase